MACKDCLSIGMLKSLLLLFFIVRFSELPAQKFHTLLLENEPMAAIPALTYLDAYDSIYVFLNSSNINNNVVMLKQSLKKIGKWSETAKNNNVENFEKSFKKGFRVNYLCFNYNNASYITSYSSLDTSFYVDDKGEVYVRFTGFYDGSISASDIIAVTQSSSYGISMGSKLTSSYSSSDAITELRKKVKFDFHIDISLNDLSTWLFDLQNTGEQLKEKKLSLKKENKRIEKLFR